MRDTHLRALLNHAVSVKRAAERPLGRMVADSLRLGNCSTRRRRTESAFASIASVAVVAAVSFAPAALGHTHNHGAADNSAASRQMAYVLTLSSPGAGAVVPVNLATMKAGKPLHSGLKGVSIDSNDLVVAPGGRTLYVGTKRGRILQISTKTGKIERTIQVAGFTGGPDNLLAGADATIAYAQSLTTITPIDLVTGTAFRPIFVSAASEAFRNIAVSRNGRTLLMGGLRTVTVVSDRRARQPIRLKGPIDNTCVAVSPNGATGYALRRSLKGRYSLLPIDVATNKALRPISLRSQNYDVRVGTCQVAVAPNGRTAYVQIGRYVVPIDLAAGRALQPIELPAESADFAPLLGVDPDSRIAYALGDQVFPVDLATHKALPAINFAVDFSGSCLSFSPNGKTALVGCRGNHNIGKLLLIHAATGKAGKTLRLRGLPVSIATAP
jgi:DNA-binding beta-propeller fold protein YncE